MLRLTIIAAALVAAVNVSEAQRPTVSMSGFSGRAALHLASSLPAVGPVSVDSTPARKARDWAPTAAIGGALLGVALWYVTSRGECGGDNLGPLCGDGAPWRVALTGAALGFVGGWIAERVVPRQARSLERVAGCLTDVAAVRRRCGLPPRPAVVS